MGVFSGYPGRYPGEMPGWPEEYPEVRLPWPRGSISALWAPKNTNAVVSNYQITNIEKASSRAWCIAAICVPLFSYGPCLALLRERERERGPFPLFVLNLKSLALQTPDLMLPLYIDVRRNVESKPALRAESK